MAVSDPSGMLPAMSSRTRSEFGSLGDRAAVQQAAGARVRFVLVDGAVEGLLARWRRTAAGGWEGLVATAAGPDDFVAQWLPAERLTPVPVAGD